MRQAFRALAVSALFTLAACSQAPAAPDPAMPTPEPIAPTPEPAAPTTPEPIVSPEPAREGTPQPAVGRDCDPGELPDFVAGWQQLTGEGYSVAYPDGWDDLSGVVNFDIETLLDEATLAETGLAGTQVRADFVRDPAGLPNFSVFGFEGVTADSATFLQRQVARLEALPDVTELHTTLPDVCLDGISAGGLELFFDTGDGSLIYQQSLYLVREGVGYHVQWLDEDDSRVPQVLRHVLNSWRWTERTTGASGLILTAGMALEPPPSGSPVDPSTFRSTFPADAPRIYLVYELVPGSVATVTFDWYQNGEFIFSDTFDWTATTTWGWSAIGPPSGGFEPGVYEAEIRLDTGESRKVSFTIEEP